MNQILRRLTAGLTAATLVVGLTAAAASAHEGYEADHDEAAEEARKRTKANGQSNADADAAARAATARHTSVQCRTLDADNPNLDWGGCINGHADHRAEPADDDSGDPDDDSEDPDDDSEDPSAPAADGPKTDSPGPGYEWDCGFGNVRSDPGEQYVRGTDGTLYETWCLYDGRRVINRVLRPVPSEG